MKNSPYKYRKSYIIMALLIFISLLVVAVILFLSSKISPPKMGYEEIFDHDVIAIRINIDDEDWQDILENARDKEYKSATVKIGSLEYNNVAIRTKGGSTLRNIASHKTSDRYSFRLNFGKYIKGQTLAGLDNMVLNNCFADPSYMREHFTYDALRAIGGNAPLFTFSNVYVNDELIGLYYSGEHINDSYIERNFKVGGNLYKADVDADFLVEESSDYPKFEHKDGADVGKSGLKDLIATLNSMPNGEKGNIESVLDVDSALRYIALNTVAMSYDSYSGPFANNFYMYEYNGVFHMIPWDYNMSIDGFSPRFINDDEPIEDYLITLRTDNVSIFEPVYHTSMEERPLISNLLSVPEYRERYIGFVNGLIDYFDDFDEKVQNLTTTLRPYIERDPTRLYSMRLFEMSVSPVRIELLPEDYRHEEFKSHKISRQSIIILMQDRIDFIKKELEQENT